MLKIKNYAVAGKLIAKYKEELKNLEIMEELFNSGQKISIAILDPCRALRIHDFESDAMIDELLLVQMRKRITNVENALINMGVDIDNPFETLNDYGIMLSEFYDK